MTDKTHISEAVFPDGATKRWLSGRMEIDKTPIIKIIETPRYGRAKITTVYRDFNNLRTAIRGHDTFAIEAAWEKCERWVDYVFGKVTK